MILRVNASVIVLILVINEALTQVDYDDRSSNDLCSICSCSYDETSVDCSMKGLTELPSGKAEKVTKINASDNLLSAFPTNLDRFPNLVRLDLSKNQIDNIPVKALDNLLFLEVLNLSRNAFTSWISMNPNDVLEPAVKLRVLDLSHNKLQTLGNLQAEELLVSSSLEQLILDSCEIDSVHGRSPLSGLSNIRILKLSNNPLRRVQNLVSASLRLLDVSNCMLSFVYYDSLEYLPSLTHLNLAHNYRLAITTSTTTLMSETLRYLDISYCNLMKPSISGFPNLRRAIINHNLIRFIDSEFVNSTHLEYLDLSYNSIGSFKSNSFKGLENLKYLDLSWNEIANLPEDALKAMPKVTQINLARNYITKVEHLKSISLKTLDLSQCEISLIGKDSLEGLQSLIDLDLSRNLLSRIPDGISSNTLQYLNLNYNRISSVSNLTFFMLPRLTAFSVVGNRFTTIWSRSYFYANPYLEKISLDDNMWRCECSDENMYDFYEFLTLEPNKKEESYNLVCHSPNELIGHTWFQGCYYSWFPNERTLDSKSVVWFLITMIIGLALCFIIVSAIRSSMKRRLEAMQAERERQVEEARDRLRQLRVRAEQEAQLETPDPRDLIPPPSYTEALSMPKLNTSCHSLNETGSGKARKKRGRRKTKSSGDLLEETERSGENRVYDDFELSETPQRNRRRRRSRKCGSHELTELEDSPGSRRRRRMSYYETDGAGSTSVEVEHVPLRLHDRRNSIDDDDPRESDF